MEQYHDLLRHIKAHGIKKSDRTGVGTISTFGYQMRFDLEKGFPLVTTKKVNIKAIIYELLWFLKGETNIKYLKDHGITIWDEWADENGDLGPVYGKQWRSWTHAEFVKGHAEGIEWVADGYQIKTIDQIAQVIDSLRRNPDSRRHIVSVWNPPDIPKMALPPCHCLFQFYVADDKLSCQLYQRSADVFLGVPFNIANYALLTMMMAQVTDLKPGEFIHTFGDVHIYLNHLEQVDLQLSREPRALPTMFINPYVENIDAFEYEDFQLFGYDHHPTIRADIAV